MMSTEEIEVDCPVCRKKHVLKKEIDIFYCKNVTLALIHDRLGWRLIRVGILSEKQDRELDRLWGNEDEG